MSVALITANPKFLLLVRRLRLPLPYVRGVLDTLWDTCHANADPVIGTPDEVEAAAQWPGEDGALFHALSTLGWIEPLHDTDKWMVHDYWDHAPNYVHDRLKKRKQREDKKRKVQECPGTVLGQAWDNPTLTLALDPALTSGSSKENTKPPRKRAASVAVSPFIEHPPQMDEVAAYLREKGASFNADEFLTGMERSGWTWGKYSKPVIDWKAEVRTWIKVRQGTTTHLPAPARAVTYRQLP